MKYRYNCPFCKKPLSVSAESDDDALSLLLEKVSEHKDDVHPAEMLDLASLDGIIRKEMVSIESFEDEF
ncbi:MAG TPA: hypothetical protein VJC17_03440 [Candidatus Dojkabacteria bacterium]|nr:hypothetical protein [Candidatus Dojkabacteria bacterium]